MEKMTFEMAASRLDEIVDKLQNGNLSLEEMIKLYEEGTALASKCAKALEKAQIRISELKSEKDGE